MSEFRIILDLAAMHDVSVDDVLGRSLDPRLVAVRAMAAHAMRSQGLSTPKIGKAMRRDHSSIVHLLQTRNPDGTPRFARGSVTRNVHTGMKTIACGSVWQEPRDNLNRIRSRQKAILAMISAGLVTAREIAERVGCGKRTVYRDVECLRDYGARISGSAGAGYMILAGRHRAIEPGSFASGAQR